MFPARHSYEDSNNNSETSTGTEVETVCFHSNDEDEDESAYTVDCAEKASAAAQPYFGNVSVTNSADVHFGNKTVYQGPVTIKQIVYNNEDKSENNVIKNGANKCEEGQQDEGDVMRKYADTTDVVKDNVFIETLKKKKKLILIALIFSLLMILSLSVTMIVLLRNPSMETTVVNHKDSAEDDASSSLNFPDDNITLPTSLRIVPRREWLAQPYIQRPSDLKTPVPLVIIMHTATENCTSIAECIFNVRRIQMFHIESNGWNDIGYNFLIGGDGYAYTGRGWTFEGAHTYGYNAKSIGIAFIGTFIKTKPPTRQIESCHKLIAFGVEKGYIDKNYKVLAARQLQATESPGAALFEDIKTWPHWSPTP